MSSELSNSAFDQLSRAELSILPDAGFNFVRGVFYRDLEGGIRHLLILDFDKRKRCFFALVGVNSRVLAGDSAPDEAGAYVSRYVGLGGLSATPSRFAASDRASATKSLEDLRALLTKHAFPWWAAFPNSLQLADALDDRYDMLKGRLYLDAGDSGRAEEWLRKYEKRLLEMAPDPSVQSALEETRRLLTGL